jgi:hypothetical protein
MNEKKDSPQPTKQILRRTDFDKQLTQSVMERVVKQTMQLVAQVEKKTPWRDQLGPDDRLHAAILKTLEGTRRWDPERVDLGGHLFGIVASDISHELEHGEQFAHLSLEQDEHHSREALLQETEETLARCAPNDNRGPLASAWSLAMGALRDVARGEPDVLAILDAYEEGAFTKRDVMRIAKLKARAYGHAHARLVELAQTVDDETRDLILQAIA